MLHERLSVNKVNGSDNYAEGTNKSEIKIIEVL